MNASSSTVLPVGLTGGIACGRTTVCGVFARLGAGVIDLDEIAHDLVKPGGRAVRQVLAVFGDRFRDESGGVDRRALAAEVFVDPEKRRRLERILHPMIIAEADKVVARRAAESGRGLVIIDGALLVETGGYRRYPRLIVVVCDPEIQLERLMRRDGLGKKEARARIAAQAPLAEKVRLADYVIDTSGTKAETEVRARQVHAMLLDDLNRFPDLPARGRA